MQRKRSKPKPKARLPLELMLAVVNNVTDPSTLRNLSLVSKTLREISQGLLFEQIAFDTSRQQSEKFLDVICGYPESRLYKYVREVKVTSAAMIPEELHKILRKREQALQQMYGTDQIRPLRTFDPAFTSARSSSIKNSASELEFWMNRLWMSCRRSIHTLSFEIIKYDGLNELEEVQMQRYFCHLIALSPMMRYDFPKLVRLELKGTNPRSLAPFMRASVLSQLPQYVDDPRGGWKITMETETSMFWRTKIGSSDKTIQDGTIRINQRRLKDIKITFTEERPSIVQGQGAFEPPYDAMGFFIHHLKPTKIDLDFREKVRMNNLLCGTGEIELFNNLNQTLPTNLNTTAAAAAGIIPTIHILNPTIPTTTTTTVPTLQLFTPPPSWYENTIEELSLANCIITAGLLPAITTMRQLNSLRLTSVRNLARNENWGSIFRSCAVLPNLTNIKLEQLHNGITARFCIGPREGWTDNTGSWADILGCGPGKDYYADKPMLFESPSCSTGGYIGISSKIGKFALCSKIDDDAQGFLELYKSQYGKWNTRHYSSGNSKKEQWDRSDWILCWHGDSADVPGYT